MPNPSEHDQPAEGGSEEIERALQKQSERSLKPQRDETKETKTPPEKEKT